MAMLQFGEEAVPKWNFHKLVIGKNGLLIAAHQGMDSLRLLFLLSGPGNDASSRALISGMG